MDELTFRSCSVGEDPAATLIAAMGAEIAEIYDGLDIDGPDMPRAGPRELSPPDGDVVVGWLGDRPVCCGGIKRLPDGGCEFKRMYVTPPARGRGLSAALLGALEKRARTLGYGVARIDTGPRQPQALRLFERAGYAEIADFNANPIATYFGEKRL